MAEPESAEQVERQSNTQEATTTRKSAETDTDREQPLPPMSPQTGAPATVVTSEPMEPEPVTQTNNDTNEPEEQEPVTQEDDVTLETTTSTTQGQGQQPSNDATENITPELGQNVCAVLPGR